MKLWVEILQIVYILALPVLVLFFLFKLKRYSAEQQKLLEKAKSNRK